MRTKLKKGFTLIELLVVIAIIGLLSSIVLASLNTARAKARNAQTYSQVHQYQTAFSIYNLDNNGFPVPANINQLYCLGGTGTCQFGSNTPLAQSSALSVALGSYIPSFPVVNTQLVSAGSVNYQGGAYECTAISGGQCSNAILFWVVEGTTNCGPGTLQLVLSGGALCSSSADGSGAQYGI